MNNQRGFSLIEMLISLVIVAVMVVGIIGLISGAGKSASRQAQQASQNGQLRNAMQIVQSSLANADKPLLYVPATQQGGSYLPQGNEIIYSRTDDRGPGHPVKYAAERIRFLDENNDGSGDIVLQRIDLSTLTSTERTTRRDEIDANDNGSVWDSAPTKVLLTNAKYSTTNPLFKFKSQAGTPAKATAAGVDDVALVDVALLRDEDGSDTRVAAAALKTSVYLRKIGGRTTNLNPVGCETP